MSDMLLQRLSAERDAEFDRKIVAFFKHKFDTAEIAKMLGVKQSAVANRLAAIRDNTCH